MLKDSIIYPVLNVGKLASALCVVPNTFIA